VENVRHDLERDTDGITARDAVRERAVVSDSAGTRLAPAPRASRHRYLIFAIVSVALFMSSVDLTIVSTALPTIGRDLGGAGLNWTAWIITIYSLGRVVTTPLVGRLSEIMGTRSIFIAAVALFTAASLLCGLAVSLPLLIVLRAIQAVGGSAFVPAATGLVADSFGRNRDRAVGLFSSIFPIGAIVGPVLGGVLVTYWSWRGVFLINVPIGIAIVAVAPRVIPVGTPKPSARFDLPGSALLCSGLLCAALAVTYLGDAGNGPTDPAFLALAAVAVGTGTLLVRRSGRPGAILPRRLLRGNGNGAMNIINLLFGAAAIGMSALVPLYAQDRYGLSSLSAGTLLTARGIGMIAIAGMATFALRRTGYRLPMVVGYLLSGAGLAMLAAPVPHGISPHLWLSVSSLVVGIGMGTALPASNNASMQIDPSQAASVAGLRVTLRQLGSIAAVSVTTALMSRGSSPGLTEAWVFGAFGVLLVATLALVPLVPEHRSSW